jgi:heme exporter protein C
MHQGTTVMRLDGPAIAPEMLWPLLSMAIAFKLYYVIVMMLRARGEILARETKSRWVRELVGGE